MASFGYVLIWWLVSTLLAFIALPLTTKIFRFLPDKGLGLARITGLLFTAYLAWLLGFAHNSFVTSILAWAALGGLGWWIYSKDKGLFKDLWAEHKGLIAVYEALFLFLFLAWALVRMYNPDILNTEKFMDFAFFNTLQRDGRFPPYDPWLAGPKLYLNYYYFGYFAFAQFARLTFLSPDVCYNLVIAFVFGLSGQILFSIAWNCTKALWPGFVGVGMLQVFGNLHGGLQVLFDRHDLNIDWWAPTRLIRDVAKQGAKGNVYLNAWWHSASESSLKAAGLTQAAAKDGAISEFPVFSFLHGDMHPHFTAIPFALLALALGLNLLKNEDRDPLNFFEASSARMNRILTFIPLALLLGVLFMSNTWDVPAYGLAFALMLFCHQHFARRFGKEHWLKSWFLPSAGLLLGLFVFAAGFLIFFINPAKQGFGISKARTGMHDTLIFWGGFLAVLLPFLALRTWIWAKALAGSGTVQMEAPSAKASTRTRKCANCGAKLRPGKPFCAQCGARNDESSDDGGAEAMEALRVDASAAPALYANLLKLFVRPAEALRDTRVAVISGLGLVLLAVALVMAPTTGLFLLLIGVSKLLIGARQDKPEALFSIALIALGSFLALVPEWFYLKDVFEGNPSLTRMNTIFKFYFQGWIILSVAAPFALWWTVQAMGRMQNLLVRPIYLSLLGLVFLLGALYPLGAFNVVSNNFMRDSQLSPTLKGDAWFKREFPGDWEMVQWMRKNIEGKAVVAEAVGGAYSKFARIASFTGLAAVVGWGNHESQWRQKWPTETEADVNELYMTTDVAKAQELVKKYGIQYVFCGALERQKYNPDQLNKFANFMEIVPFKPAGTTVYKARN